MRLIDADVPIETAKNYAQYFEKTGDEYSKGISQGLRIAIACVEDQPTIELDTLRPHEPEQEIKYEIPQPNRWLDTV